MTEWRKSHSNSLCWHRKCTHRVQTVFMRRLTLAIFSVEFSSVLSFELKELASALSLYPSKDCPMILSHAFACMNWKRVIKAFEECSFFLFLVWNERIPFLSCILRRRSHFLSISHALNLWIQFYDGARWIHCRHVVGRENGKVSEHEMQWRKDEIITSNNKYFRHLSLSGFIQ